MKEERNIITMDGQGNIFLPSDIGATAMTEREICELFGVIAPTVRAGIKALCKSGVLSIYDIKRIIRISDRYSAEVYNLETIAALAFRIESFAGIKALCKSGVLSIYDIKRIIRISDRYSAEVYNLETIAALAFRIESFVAAKVRKVLLERIINGRKEKTTVFVSVVSDGKPNSRWKA